MFLSELNPALQKLIQQPFPFTSGFVSGILQLKLNEEPLSEWLEKQGYNSSPGQSNSANSDSSKPQSINID